MELRLGNFIAYALLCFNQYRISLALEKSNELIAELNKKMLKDEFDHAKKLEALQHKYDLLEVSLSNKSTFVNFLQSYDGLYVCGALCGAIVFLYIGYQSTNSFV